MKETEQAIRELSQRYFACEKILEDWNLPNDRRVWFEEQQEIARDGLARFGVDEIIAIRGGEEIEEVVIYQADEGTTE